MTPSVSILIPTHDRAAVLRQSLESLCQLTVPTGAAVEVVVVANACTDETESVVHEMLAALPFPGKCVTELRANLNVARNAAVANSRHDVLALLDDDVWVHSEWLSGLIDAYSNREVDVVAGPIDLWWKDVERPAWFSRVCDGLLTCKDFGDAPKRLTSPFEPAGANFSFRRKVFETIGPFVEGLDRTGTNVGLSAGETEFLQRALDAGFGLYYYPRVRIKHWVAPYRAQAGYLRRVAFADAASRTLIKRRFGVYAVCRCAVGNSGLYFWHALRGAWYHLLGNRTQAVVSQIQRARARGAVFGMWLRLAGRSPMPRSAGSRNRG
jgi:glycosyltransferase involved in cell wall biosynthesis